MKRTKRIRLSGISVRNILIELFVVFCGVYMAFYLNDRAENAKVNKQSVRILKSLRIELEQMRIFFPGQANYMRTRVEEWSELYNNKEWGEFYDWRYLQPQYNYTVLEYALNERESDIIDFEMSKELMQVYRNIQQLIESENAMTAMGYAYHPSLANVKEGDPLYQQRNENLFHFYKFINAATDRANSLDEVAVYANNALALIEAKFTRQENLDMIVELSQYFIDNGNSNFSREQMGPLLIDAYPQYTKEEIDYVLENLKFKASP